MIEMKVMGIALDTRTGSPIVVLHDMDNRKALPIWIGSAEASAIIRRIENIEVSRPMTHDLIASIVEKTGGTIDRVEINDVEKETYYAIIYIKDKEGNEISILDILKAPKPDFVEEISKKDNVLLLNDYLEVLTDREKDIIEKRYGLYGTVPLTQKKIASNMKISRSYVSRIEKRALTKILREFIKNNHYEELDK